MNSHPASIAPKSDVKAVAEAESPVTAGLSKPDGMGVQFCTSASFRHEKNALPRERMGQAKRLDLIQIRGVGNHELEPRFR